MFLICTHLIKFSFTVSYFFFLIWCLTLPFLYLMQYYYVIKCFKCLIWLVRNLSLSNICIMERKIHSQIQSQLTGRSQHLLLLSCFAFQYPTFLPPCGEKKPSVPLIILTPDSLAVPYLCSNWAGIFNHTHGGTSIGNLQS